MSRARKCANDMGSLYKQPFGTHVLHVKRLELLAEARIREWQKARSANAPGTTTGSPAEPLEVRLWNQIRALRDQARLAAGQQQSELRKKASALETQLLVLLETTGRPLAAVKVAEALQSPSKCPAEDLPHKR
jgi:hypothetical protein